MSSCDLEIVLERPDAAFRLGEAVRGVVGVTVDKTCRCKALKVWVEWYTHGSGNVMREAASEQVLFEGEWTAGEKHLFPFDVKIGDGPLPYAGHHVSVGWRVVATAAIPWGFDPRAEVDLAVSDDPDLPAVSHGSMARTGPIFEAARLLQAVVGLIVGGFGAFGLTAGACATLGVAFEEKLPVALLVGAMSLGIPSVFLFIGGGMAFRVLGPWLAGRRLGEPVITVTPDTLRGGESFTVQVRTTPRSTTAVGEVYALLVGRERAISGSGTKTRTYTHDLWSERIPLGSPGTVRSGVEIAFTGTGRVPNDPAPSLAVPSNTVEWAVEIHAELPRRPDWVTRYGLLVRP